MITLSATDSLSGLAGTASAITYTLLGDNLSSSGDAFGVLAQGVLGSSAGTVLATSASHQRLIKSIFLNNTTGSAVFGIKFYVNGTSSSNQIVSLQIPANGSASYESGQGWRVYDITGALATTSIQGQQGIQGIQGFVGPTQVFNGTATLDFGSVPGGNRTSVVITGQTGILTTSTVSVFMMSDTTTDHNTAEHHLAPIKLTSSIPINNTGFTIIATSEWRLSGTFLVRWAWNN